MSARTKAFLLLLLVAFIWGLAPPIVKHSYQYFPPIVFLAYRFFLSILILIPLLLITQKHTWKNLNGLSEMDWIYLIFGAFVGSTVQLGLLFWGLSLSTSLDSSVIGSTSPMLVALAGHYFLKEHITLKEKIGHMIAFIGSIVIVIQPIFSGEKLFSGNIAGNCLTFLGTLAWVFYVLWTKKELRHKLSPLFLTTFMFLVGFISMFLISLIYYPPTKILSIFDTATLGAHAGIWFMAFISGAFAYWAYQKAQKTVEVSTANILLYLSPLFTIPIAYFWLHEPITLGFGIGSAIILAGVVFPFLRR